MRPVGVEPTPAPYPGRAFRRRDINPLLCQLSYRRDAICSMAYQEGHGCFLVAWASRPCILAEEATGGTPVPRRTSPGRDGLLRRNFVPGGKVLHHQLPRQPGDEQEQRRPFDGVLDLGCPEIAAAHRAAVAVLVHQVTAAGAFDQMGFE